MLHRGRMDFMDWKDGVNDFGYNRIFLDHWLLVLVYNRLFVDHWLLVLVYNRLFVDGCSFTYTW